MVLHISFLDYIPKGLKVNDRVLWYSGKGPVPGTIQRLFKDGTDKYTAMVKFVSIIESLCTVIFKPSNFSLI